MPINDFLRLSSVTFPKDNFAKIPTNKRFNTKIVRKNNQDMFRRNKGMPIEKADVAITQLKIIFFKLSGWMDWFIVGKPACSYSCPYFNINNQKWGICQINRKKAIKTMVDSKMYPPAAVQPINAGTAPTSDPGTTANGVRRLRFV